MRDSHGESEKADVEAVHLEIRPSHTSGQTAVAVLGLLTLCAWVIWRFGGTDYFQSVTFAGQQESIVDTFASIDHPFHATRAASLLESLRAGELPRWVGNHQGGYPVEFYPLGVAWFEVVLWGTFLGTLPVLAVHKLAILLIFVLPALGFWIIARGDRLNPWLPVLATALHVSIPGLWTHGGYEELVRWGLVTNVAGAALALIASAALARAVIQGQAWWGMVAAIGTALAVYTNPRSVLAIIITAAAIAASAVFARRDDPTLSPPLIARRITLVGVASALLAAPVLLPLLRYRDLYFFVHYESYASLSEYWSNTLTSASPLVVILAVGGVMLAIGLPRFAIARAYAMALIAYALLTAALSANPGVIEQLEPPRLMPFQRLVMIYLAALAITQAIQSLVRFFRIGRPATATCVGVGTVAVLVLILMWGSVWTPPRDFRTFDPDTTADGTFVQAPGATPESEFLAFQNAVHVADDARPEGTAILVIGDREYRDRRWWHEQLWGPSMSDAPFFYDDWLWYWHTDHEGPYNYLQGHSYRDPSETFEPRYLQAHGIGAVMVTDMPVPPGAVNLRLAAQRSPHLNPSGTRGKWDVYTVADPITIISSENAGVANLVIENHRLSAEFSDVSGEIDIRRNWFPRWEAFADGEPVNIERTDNGYMRLTVPPGTATVELRYATTTLDWTARLFVVLGLVLTALLKSFWNGREGERSGDQGSSGRWRRGGVRRTFEEPLAGGGYGPAQSSAGEGNRLQEATSACTGEQCFHEGLRNVQHRPNLAGLPSRAEPRFDLTNMFQEQAESFVQGGGTWR